MAETRGEQGAFAWTQEDSRGLTRTPEASTAKDARVRREARRAERKSPSPTDEQASGWLTANEATVLLRFPSRKALYDAVSRGQVPAHRLGRRRLRFSRLELESLLSR
jgi:hypothetical protein